MSKLDALSDKALTPKWILHHILEDVEDIEAVAVMVYEKGGQINLAYSHQSAEKLYSMFVKFQAVINEHALNRCDEQQSSEGGT